MTSKAALLLVLLLISLLLDSDAWHSDTSISIDTAAPEPAAALPSDITLHVSYTAGIENGCSWSPSSGGEGRLLDILHASAGAVCFDAVLVTVDSPNRTQGALETFDASPEGRTCMRELAMQVETARDAAQRVCDKLLLLDISSPENPDVSSSSSSSSSERPFRVRSNIAVMNYSSPSSIRPALLKSCALDPLSVPLDMHKYSKAFFKNTLMYFYAIHLTKTKYLLHVDDDMKVNLGHAAIWIKTALKVLVRHDITPAVSMERCERACHVNGSPDSPYWRSAMTQQPRAFPPYTVTNGSALTREMQLAQDMPSLIALLEKYAPFTPHLSLQVFLMDTLRFRTLLPFQECKIHVESVLEAGFLMRWYESSGKLPAMPCFLHNENGCKDKRGGTWDLRVKIEEEEQGG